MSTFDMLARLRPRLALFGSATLRLSMLAAMLTIGVVMAAALGLRRRNRQEGNGPVRVAIVAGTIGALAMVPVGMVVMNTTGATLNVYGELLVELLLGTVVLPALFVEHMLIGWMAALPLVMGIRHITRAPATVGAVYGAAMWLGVNALALPAAFEKPTPFAIGWTAIWPSLLVHVIYGAVTAAVATRLSPANPDIR